MAERDLTAHAVITCRVCGYPTIHLILADDGWNGIEHVMCHQCRTEWKSPELIARERAESVEWRAMGRIQIGCDRCGVMSWHRVMDASDGGRCRYECIGCESRDGSDE